MRIKDIIITLTVLVASSLQMRGEKVICIAGDLEMLVGKTAGIDELQVSGTIDARDLLFMAQMESLRSIDLSETTIEGFSSRMELIPGCTIFAPDEIPAFTFFGSPLRKMILPRSLKVIGEGAFAASSLEEIVVGDKLEKIGADAFNGCRIKSFEAPASLTVIGERAFSGCGALLRVDLSVTAIRSLPSRLFADCRRLLEFEAPANVTSLGKEVFAHSPLQILSLPMLQQSQPYALALMPKLKRAGSGAEADGMFFGDEAMVHLENMPENLSPYFLYGCAKLQDVMLAPTLQSVGAYAFSGMTDLIFIDGRNIKGDVPVADADAFHGLDVSKIELCVDGNLRDRWDAAEVWRDFHITNDVSECGIANPAMADDIMVKVVGDEITAVSSSTLDAMIVYATDGSLITSRHGAAESLTLRLPTTPRGTVLIVEVQCLGKSRSFRVLY